MNFGETFGNFDLMLIDISVVSYSGVVVNILLHLVATAGGKFDNNAKFVYNIYVDEKVLSVSLIYFLRVPDSMLHYSTS